MFTKSRSLLVLFAALFLITAACGRVPADSIGAAAAPIDQAVQEEADHADDGDDHAEEADHVEPSGDADRVVEVEMAEFTIAAHSFEFTPGETIEFIVTNSGVVEHEFRLSNQVRVDEHVAGGHADHDDAMSDEEMAEMDHDDEMTDEEMAEMPHDDSDGHHEENTDDQEADHEEAEEADHDDEEADHEEAEEADHDDDEADHDDGGHEVDDAVLVLGPGETGTLVFTFPENDHDFTAAVCLIPGHYEAGMATDLGYTA